MKRARKASAAIAISAIALTGLTACSSPEGSRAEDKQVLGIVQFSGSDVFSNSALEGGGAFAENAGWDVQTVDARGSLDEMNAAMINLVTTGVDAILVSVFPSDALAAGIASAVEAGIPVASWGGGTVEGVQFAAEVGLDEISQQMVDDMGGKGELLTLGYRPGLPCQHREESLDKVLMGSDITESKQQITIPGQVESAQAAASAWAAAHPAGGDEPLAIWSCFDDPATGVAAALRDLGRTDILSYGNNGTKAVVDLVKAGEVTATQWINGPQQGADLMALLIAYIDDPESVEVPQTIDGEVKVVTHDNVDDFLTTDPTLY